MWNGGNVKSNAIAVQNSWIEITKFFNENLKMTGNE